MSLLKEHANKVKSFVCALVVLFKNLTVSILSELKTKEK